MALAAIGIGAAFCGGGVVAHFVDPSARKEQFLALGGLCFLMVGALLG